MGEIPTKSLGLYKKIRFYRYGKVHKKRRIFSEYTPIENSGEFWYNYSGNPHPENRFPRKRKEVTYIMLDASYYRKTDEIIARYVADARSLIPIMQDIQAEYRYLPAELLSYVAQKIGITEAKAYSVATFYENFSFEAKGKYVIKVCDGTACHVRHSTPVLEALWKELGLSKKKHTTDDMLFTVETVSCLGACGLAPTMMVNEQVYPSMTPEKALALIEELRGKG